MGDGTVISICLTSFVLTFLIRNLALDVFFVPLLFIIFIIIARFLSWNSYCIFTRCLWSCVWFVSEGILSDCYHGFGINSAVTDAGTESMVQIR